MKKFTYKLLFYFFQLIENIKNKVKYQSYRNLYEIDDSFGFNGPGIYLYGEGEIVLGKSSYIGNYSTIQADKNCRVTIGVGCMISHNVRIYTSSAVVDQDFGNKPLKEKYGDVLIEDNVWIGANVFINPGVSIASNAIIGANSVVNKNVPENAIVGGVPAKLIRLKVIT